MEKRRAKLGVRPHQHTHHPTGTAHALATGDEDLEESLVFATAKPDAGASSGGGACKRRGVTPETEGGSEEEDGNVSEGEGTGGRDSAAAGMGLSAQGAVTGERAWHKHGGAMGRVAQAAAPAGDMDME